MDAPGPKDPVEAGAATLGDPTLVDRTLASGFPLMAFPAELERRFERDTGRQRCRELVVRGLLGLALFNVFLVSDWTLMPDQVERATWLRLGVVTPIALGFMLITHRQPPPVLREALQAVIVVLATTVPPLLILTSTSPLRESGHHAILLVVMFATMVQRIRFWYVLPAVLAIEAMYVGTLLALGTLGGQEMLAFNMIFTGGVIFSLVASYNLEREQRRTYLLGLRDRLRNAALETISRRDPLTGLGNRRSLDEALAGLAPSDDEVAVLLLDIDGFKAYNDGLGHQAGDFCLRRIAAVITAELRAGSDRAFRYGGEEFLLLLRRTDLDDALFIAERLRLAIEAVAIPRPGGAGVVTGSIGVAAARLEGGISIEQLVANADAALYVAKREGRNLVAPRRSGPPRRAADDEDDVLWAPEATAAESRA